MKKCKPLFMEYDTDQDGNRVCGDIVFPKDEMSLTRQSDADEVNIPLILARCSANNEQMFPRVRPVFTDLTNGQDYLEKQKSLAQLNTYFECLPVNVKEKFHNSPAEMLDFMADKKNLPEVYALGFGDKKDIEGMAWNAEKLMYEKAPAAAPAAGGAPAGQSPVAG